MMRVLLEVVSLNICQVQKVVDLHNHISHLKLSFFHFISSFLLLPSQRGPETKINKREKEE